MVHKSIHAKQNQKQITHESKNITHASNWKKKTLEILKRIKKNFFNVRGDKFAMRIR